MCAPAASTPTGTSSAPSSAATWAPWEAQTSSTLWEPGRAMGHGGRTSPRTRRPSGPGWHPASHESRVVTPLGGVRGYGLPSASGELPEGDVPTEWRGESQNLLPSTALRPCPRTDVGASDEALAPCWEQLSDAYGNPSTGWGRRNVVQGWNPGPSGPGGCQGDGPERRFSGRLGHVMASGMGPVGKRDVSGLQVIQVGAQLRATRHRF